MINKKNLGLTTAFILLLFASFSFVLAQPAGSGGAALQQGKQITEPTWLIEVAEFLKIGGDSGTTVTWQGLFIGIAVLLMLFAFTYEIVGFTPFQKEWTKFLVAIAISLVVSISGGVNGFAAWMINFIGGSILIGAFASLGLAIGFFVLGTWLRGIFLTNQAKQDIRLAKVGYAAGEEATVARVREALRVGKETKRDA